MGNVILHAFNWKFEEVQHKAPEIREIGYSGVLISPPALSEGEYWYDRYQPVDYRIIHSPLGDLKNLKEMIDALKQNGLKIFVDIVFNHMAHRPDDHLDFPGNELLTRYKNEPLFKENQLFGNLEENLFSSGDFNPKGCIQPAAYDDVAKIDEVQNSRICDVRVTSGLPDLNGKSPRVINSQRDYLSALKTLGVDGFRIDAAKHMTVEHIQHVFTEDIVGSLFVFGEIIPAGHGQFLNEFMQSLNFSAYDFNLFYSLHQALQADGSFEALADPNELEPFKSVTFTVTHDIPNNESMRLFIFDAEDEERTDENIAYAYVLGRDGGVPLVYSDHGTADNVYTNLWNDAYNKPPMKKMISFHNALFGKKMEVLSAGKCHLIINREGAGILLLNKGAETQTIDVATGGLKGLFKNILEDTSISITGEHHTFDIPPRMSQLYIKS